MVRRQQTFQVDNLKLRLITLRRPQPRGWRCAQFRLRDYLVRQFREKTPICRHRRSQTLPERENHTDSSRRNQQLIGGRWKTRKIHRLLVGEGWGEESRRKVLPCHLRRAAFASPAFGRGKDYNPRPALS